MTTSDQSQAAPTSPAPSPEPQNVREAFMQVLASLVAAVSLLKRGGKTAKKAAPSDKMFDQMILDYEKAIEQGRAALAQSNAVPKQEVRDKLLRALERRRFVDEGGRYLLTQSQAFDAFTEVIAAYPALTQSNAEPVAYNRAWDAVMHSPELALTRRKLAEDELGLLIKVVAASLYASPSPNASAGLIEAAEWLSTAASRFEEAADALRSEYKTYARQMDRRWAGVHGELIPDCPTDGVAARQGNGG
jgi:hypothetical protein